MVKFFKIGDGMYCKNCGKEIDDKAEICVGCGVRVKDVLVGKKKSRTAEMILGVLGGIFGIFSGIFAVFVGGMGGAFGASGASTITGLGMSAIILGIIGIVGGAIVNKNINAAKYLMLFSGIVGFIAISAFWIIAGIMLIVGGILALRK
jgi:hypothetical protein